MLGIHLQLCWLSWTSCLQLELHSSDHPLRLYRAGITLEASLTCLITGDSVLFITRIYSWAVINVLCRFMRRTSIILPPIKSPCSWIVIWPLSNPEMLFKTTFLVSLAAVVVAQSPAWGQCGGQGWYDFWAPRQRISRNFSLQEWFDDLCLRIHMHIQQSLSVPFFFSLIFSSLNTPILQTTHSASPVLVPQELLHRLLRWPVLRQQLAQAPQAQHLRQPLVGLQVLDTKSVPFKRPSTTSICRAMVCRPSYSPSPVAFNVSSYRWSSSARPRILGSTLLYRRHHFSQPGQRFQTLPQRWHERIHVLQTLVIRHNRYHD